MLKREIFSKIDHTELRPNATIEDYVRLCEEARQYGVPAVCIPPNIVGRMRMWLPDTIHVCTVVGFPSGYNTLETKAWETKEAILNGADEIDMVINIGAAVHSGQMGDDLDEVRREIERVRDICIGNVILKVIIETCFLSEVQKINLCRVVTEAKADFIKTSTGFGVSGANLADIELFRQYLGENVKIKAAGGISTIESAKQFIEAGCSRIGSSKLVRLLAEVDGNEV